VFAEATHVVASSHGFECDAMCGRTCDKVNLGIPSFIKNRQGIWSHKGQNLPILITSTIFFYNSLYYRAGYKP